MSLVGLSEVEQLRDANLRMAAGIEEMAARIERLEAALTEVRHWIVCSGVEHPSIPCSMIDAALAGTEGT